MTESHLFLTLVFSLCVSAVFAGLLRDVPREQVILGARMFGAMAAAAVALGWLMYPFPI